MRALLFLLLLSAGTLSAHAQTARLTDASVVRDSSGMTYPAPVWKSLMNRHYKLVAVDPRNPESEFLITKMSEAEIDARMQRFPKPKESTAFATGKKPKLFKVQDVEGNMVDLKAAAGKIVVLNFWFINCPPCRREIPDLNELVAEFRNDSSVLFVAVALDDKESLQAFLKNNPFHYKVIDKGSYFAQDNGVRLFPTHAVIDGEGKVYFHTEGLAQNTVYWIRKSIRELLQKKGSLASK